MTNQEAPAWAYLLDLLLDFWLTTDATPVHDARALTEGGSFARIVLDGQVYALRITRAGKLILTK